jgi:tripartite-type tricarboxylate transporter receptor subunit TctC
VPELGLPIGSLADPFQFPKTRRQIHEDHFPPPDAACSPPACCQRSPASAPTPRPIPAKPITFVVPFAAGSATDQLARALGQSITDQSKQAVVVDNKGGASGMIAAQQVAKAAPDGYTVLITTNTTHAANEHLYKKLPTTR